MLRRRLFAYAVMFTLGIASGYLFFECDKYLESVVMMLGFALAARRIDLEYIPEKTELERRLIISWILIGFVVFTSSYIGMNSVVRDEYGSRVKASEVGSISGRIVEISRRNITDESEETEPECQANYYYKIVVKPESIRCHGKVQLNYYSEFEDVNPDDNEIDDYIDMIGRRVTLYGELRKPAGIENPGCFNYKSYLYSRGIRFIYSCKYMKLEHLNEGDLDLLFSDIYWKFERKLMHIRKNFLKQFSTDTKPFIKGIVFGDKSEIDEDMLEEFNANSTGHILAVSGLHVGFLFLLLRIITRKKKTKLINGLIIAIILLYGEMTGWSPATARAMLVLGISILALYARRAPDLLTSVSAAAIVILTISPYNIVSSGFQMSFIALLGMCFLSSALEPYIGEYMSVPVAIQLAVAPMIAYTYCQFNITSMFINIPIVFIASLLVPICLLGLMLMIYAGFTPRVCILLIEGLTQLITTINNKCALDKMYVTDIKGLTAVIMIAYYIAIFFISSEWTRIKLIRKEYLTIRRTAAYLLIPIICIGIATHNPYLDDEIVFVNVGQGDCTHIRCNDSDILIDGGGNQYNNVGKNTLRPYLLHNNVGNIDLALITHEHMDHYKGIEELKKIYPIESVQQGHSGENYTINKDVWIETIWPDEHTLKSNSHENENELNSVYIIHYNSIKLMITGDLTQADEMQIINRYRGTDTLDCDILKVGHHGSKTSTSNEFLDSVSPDIAIISVGAHNSYGHPHQEIIERLNEHNINVYRTDLNGAIGIDIRGNRILIDKL